MTGLRALFGVPAAQVGAEDAGELRAGAAEVGQVEPEWRRCPPLPDSAR